MKSLLKFPKLAVSREASRGYFIALAYFASIDLFFGVWKGGS